MAHNLCLPLFPDFKGFNLKCKKRIILSKGNIIYVYMKTRTNKTLIKKNLYYQVSDGFLNISNNEGTKLKSTFFRFYFVTNEFDFNWRKNA